MFTMVTDEHCQSPEHSYHTAGGTDIDLTIQDEERMAHLCHFVMVHTATSLHLAQQGQPTKQQYGLKAGLKRFGSRGDTAVTKELSQLHTMNCFRPCDPHSLTRDDRRNALSSLMFLTEKRTGEVKARACANGSVQRQHVAKEEAAAHTVTSEALLPKVQFMLMKTVTWRPVISLAKKSLSNIVWYIDASHQLHDDCKGHTGSILTFGRGATTSSSTKDTIPSKSSCKSKIICLYDKIGDDTWMRQFLEAEG